MQILPFNIQPYSIQHTCLLGNVNYCDYISTDIDECASNPCKSGQCVDKENGFKCICESGFVGELCDEGM